MNINKSIIVFVGLWMWHCADLPLPVKPYMPNDKLLLVTTSDFSTGFLSAISLVDNTVYQDIYPTHSDAFTQNDGENIFIVNRLGQDNISKLNIAEKLNPHYETTTGTQSNPSDFTKIDATKAIISLYGKNYLLVIDINNGKEISRIDLSSFADGDGLSEISSIYKHNNNLYVTIQRLNRNATGPQTWSPVDISYLARISLTDLQLKQSWPLPYTNPISKIRYFANHNSLTFCAPALYASNYALDGGIIEFDLTSKTFLNSPLTEIQANFEISEAILINPTLGFAIGSDSNLNSVFVAFNPNTKTIIKTMAQLSFSVGGFFSAIEYTNNKIYLADRNITNPGIRIFDSITLNEVTNQPISTGLPPSTLSLLKP